MLHFEPMKLTFDRSLKSHVVCKIKCNGCNSMYVCHTSGNVTIKTSEKQNNDYLVGPDNVVMQPSFCFGHAQRMSLH